MAKIKLITKGKMDSTGWKKVGKSLLLTVGGSLIGFIANLTGVVDFGGWNDMMIVLLPFVANFLYKWLGTYESK